MKEKAYLAEKVIVKVVIMIKKKYKLNMLLMKHYNEKVTIKIQMKMIQLKNQKMKMIVRRQNRILRSYK